jgi:hypothetical protein
MQESDARIFAGVELWPHTFLSEIWGEESGEEHWRYKKQGEPLRTASQQHYPGVAGAYWMAWKRESAVAQKPFKAVHPDQDLYQSTLHSALFLL